MFMQTWPPASGRFASQDVTGLKRNIEEFCDTGEGGVVCLGRSLDPKSDVAPFFFLQKAFLIIHCKFYLVLRTSGVGDYLFIFLKRVLEGKSKFMLSFW